MKPRQAYKQRTKGVPVLNKDTDRTVYVLPETLKKNPDKFEPESEEDVGDPRWRGKPKPARKPDKPQKPEVPRDAPPAPIHPPYRRKRVKRMKRVTEVPEVKPMKVPAPSPKRRWKKLKKYMPTAAVASAESVLRRYLEALERKA